MTNGTRGRALRLSVRTDSEWSVRGFEEAERSGRSVGVMEWNRGGASGAVLRSDGWIGVRGA
jgi:hypothetical protein